MEDLKALVHFPEDYFKGLATVMKYDIHNLYLEERPKNTRRVFEKFEFKGDKHSELQVLGIGTGDGNMDIPIIDTLCDKYHHANFYVVEPVESEVNKYKALVASKQEQGLWKNAEFEFHHPGTIESYLADARTGKTQNRFDVIHLQHSAYHLINVEDIFVEMYGMLNPGGMLFNLMNKGPWEKILLRTGKIIPDPLDCKFGSATLREMLQRRMPYVEITVANHGNFNFCIDECFKEDSKDGNLMLDFLTQAHNFRQNAPREIFSDIMQYLKDECCYKVDDNLVFAGEEEGIVIIK